MNTHLNSQTQFLNYLRETQSIIAPLAIPDDGLSDLQSDIEQTELIVPVVGGYSAGKSTLINSFLGNTLLPVAITPETALPAELRYSTDERIEATAATGSIERHDLVDISTLKDNAQNFQNLRIYLNNSNLQSISPLVLVDMPGFDAPLEAHNRAILNYLNRGVYFVFLIAVQDGTVSASIKREIENLHQFGKGFAFCISRTNQRAADDVAQIKEKIAEQLADDFDYTDDIALLNQDGGDNLKNILHTINPEKLFSTLFLNRLREHYSEIDQSISLKIVTLKSDKQAAEDALTQLKSSMAALERQKEKALTDVYNRYADNKVQHISEAVAKELRSHESGLIELALHNPDGMTREINELVKHRLLREVQSSFQDISRDILTDFSHSIKAVLSQSAGNLLDPSMIDRMAQHTEVLLNRANSGLHSLSASMRESSTDQNASKTYKVAATALGITTNVVSPIIEIVIIFLPEIIDFFTRGTKERKMREQVQKELIYKIIPDIKNKLNDELPKLMAEQTTKLIEQISEQFEGQLQQKRREIETAEAEKTQRASELQNLITELKQAKQQLAATANRYLFA